MSRGQPKYSGKLSDLYTGYAKKWYDHLMVGTTRLPDFSWKFREMLDKYGITSIEDVAKQLREAGVSQPKTITQVHAFEGGELYLFPVVHRAYRFENLLEAERFLAWKSELVMTEVPCVDTQTGEIEAQERLVFKSVAEKMAQDPAGAVWDRLQGCSSCTREDDIEKMLLVSSHPFTASLSKKYKPTITGSAGTPQEALHWLFSYHELSVKSVTKLVAQTKVLLKDAETMLAELKQGQSNPRERFMESLPMAAIDPSELLPGASNNMVKLVKLGASYLLQK